MVVSELASIIMPAYNSADYIEESIRSVINQQYQNWELIIVNDCSTDTTKNIIEKFTFLDKRIKYLNNVNNIGAGKSRNRALKIASGRYITFLDSDDIWKPQKLSIQIETIKKENVSVVFSSYERIDEKGNFYLKGVKAIKLLSYKKLLKHNYIGNLTGLYDASKIGVVLQPEMRKRQDWAMWLIVLQKAKKAIGIQESLAVYRVRKISVSSNKLTLIKYNFNVYNRELNFSKAKSVYYLFAFLIMHVYVKITLYKNLN
ncbi:glycosyltransferase family 2 protein [Zunongwangia sp.]|uniref:glycosyltransferase family 2 protein n=1 Tax=Zunongwangia sp. TaxID=1965325 RepID=UPI003AA95282